MSAPDNRNWRVLHYEAVNETQPGRLVINGFTWSGMLNGDHKLEFKDTVGATVLGPYYAPDTLVPVTVMFPEALYVDGLEADDLESGVVDVYLA